MTQPFAMIEKAVKNLVETRMPLAAGRVGGDLSYETDQDFYVWIGLVDGSTTMIDGLWSIDIDVFDNHYTQAMQRALDIEAILLRPGGHRTSVMRLDNVEQNQIPMERPWDDESAYRIGATYTLTARRGAGPGIYIQPTVYAQPAIPNSAPSGPNGYTHVQSSPAADWVIIHNLNDYPIPLIFLTGETSPIYTDVEYPNANTMTLSFGEPVSGTVYL